MFGDYIDIYDISRAVDLTLRSQLDHMHRQFRHAVLMNAKTHGSARYNASFWTLSSCACNVAPGDRGNRAVKVVPSFSVEVTLTVPP